MKLAINFIQRNPYSQIPVFPIPSRSKKCLISARDTMERSVANTQMELTAREKRQLRNDARESKASNWREQVEDKLLFAKPKKKRYASWTEELNLDNLALLGHQWWVLRVSRVSAHYTVQTLARMLIKHYPQMDFKVFDPAVQIKRKLKNGSISVKPKPLFPGCVFLWCVMNKEMHDFIRECEGVGGFLGSVVGNTKRQINRPKPVSVDDIQAMSLQVKEEQEKADRAFDQEQQQAEVTESILKIESYSDSKDVTESMMVPKPKGRSRKASKPLLAQVPSKENDDKLLRPGSTVQVVSGTFAEFSGTLKKVDPKIAKVTVAFTLFGKETLVDLDVSEVTLKTK